MSANPPSVAVEPEEQLRFFIGGEWIDAAGANVIDVVEAASAETMGRVALGGPADIDTAVAAAQVGSKVWAKTSPPERAVALRDMADHLDSCARRTARLVSRQNGMPITLSKGANGYFPGVILRYYADLIDRPEARDERPGSFGTRTVVHSRPLGVVGAITPWNYPQTLAVMKYAPALAAGCAVVLKPPPETSLDAYVIAEAAQAAGLPAGAVNVVPGDRDAGAHLVAHRGTAKIAFTGSTAAGRAIGEACGRLLKPVTLELGGKSAAILLDDVDINTYLDKITRVSLPNAGQTCHSSTRILVPRSRYTEMLDAVTDRVRSLRVGDPMSAETEVGPMVSAAHRRRVLDYVDLGRAEGARLTTGGGVPADLADGWFVEPTVFGDVDNSWRIAQEEIFGPVLCVIRYDTTDDAVAIANDSEYGLAGTVWTSDEERGIAVAQRIESGSVGVNHYGLDPAAPFGGWKSSGVGVELGPEGLRAYLRTTSMYLPSTAPARASEGAQQ